MNSAMLSMQVMFIVWNTIIHRYTCIKKIDGQLRRIDDITGEPGEEPFKFTISDDHKKNQDHYEQLADVSLKFIIHF